jgi:hypothetical protein
MSLVTLILLAWIVGIPVAVVGYIALAPRRRARRLARRGAGATAEEAQPPARRKLSA